MPAPKGAAAAYLVSQRKHPWYALFKSYPSANVSHGSQGSQGENWRVCQDAFSFLCMEISWLISLVAQYWRGWWSFVVKRQLRARYREQKFQFLPYKVGLVFVPCQWIFGGWKYNLRVISQGSQHGRGATGWRGKTRLQAEDLPQRKLQRHGKRGNLKFLREWRQFEGREILSKLWITLREILQTLYNYFSDYKKCKRGMIHRFEGQFNFLPFLFSFCSQQQHLLKMYSLRQRIQMSFVWLSSTICMLR